MAFSRHAFIGLLCIFVFLLITEIYQIDGLSRYRSSLGSRVSSTFRGGTRSSSGFRSSRRSFGGSRTSRSGLSRTGGSLGSRLSRTGGSGGSSGLRGNSGSDGKSGLSGTVELTTFSGQMRHKTNSSPFKEPDTFINALLNGAIYGSSSYMESVTYKSNQSTIPTICTNDYDKDDNGTTYGYFICPRVEEPDSYKYCCGGDRRETCCQYEGQYESQAPETTTKKELNDSSPLTQSTFKNAMLAGMIYGGERYMESNLYKSYPNKMPTICTNNYDKDDNGITYGYFICPRVEEPYYYKYCCGDLERETCCQYGRDYLDTTTKGPKLERTSMKLSGIHTKEKSKAKRGQVFRPLPFEGGQMNSGEILGMAVGMIIGAVFAICLSV